MADCYLDSCDNIEQITLQNVLSSEKSELNSTYFDDMQVVEAIKDNNIEYLKEYIRTHGMVDQPLTNDSMNNRLIHLIAEYGNNEMMDLILALKPDINITNVDGDTPLIFAARANKIDNVEKLINQGAELNLANLNKETAANMAIKAGNIAMLRILYNSGAGVLGTDIQGNNFLHYTVLHAPENDEKIMIIRFLLNNGVNSEALNKQKKTPLELTKIKIDKLEHDAYLGYTKDDLKGKQIHQYADLLTPEEDIIVNMRQKVESFKDANNISYWDSIVNWFTNEEKNEKKKEVKKNNSNSINKVARRELEAKHIPQIPIKKQDPQPTEMTLEMRNLLEIQTILFNNIVANNPQKYQSNYFNIAELPKGSPIEAIYDVCAGPGLTGEEDSVTCLAKGGHMVKIKNPTTRIKLDLIKSDDTKAINAIKDKDLMMPKYASDREMPDPSIIADYNQMVRSEKPVDNHTVKEKFEEHPNVIKETDPSAIASRNNAIKNTEQIIGNSSDTMIEGFANYGLCTRKQMVLLIVIILLISLFYLMKNRK